MGETIFDMNSESEDESEASGRSGADIEREGTDPVGYESGIELGGWPSRHNVRDDLCRRSHISVFA